VGRKSTGRTGIREVADHAGVAISSVSRVLSNHPDVSADMRDRVLHAVEDLGYVPDLLAQGLRRGTTSTIGFLVGDISNPLFSAIAVGAEQVLQEAGYAMVIANSLSDPDRDAAQLQVLRQRRVDGLIISLTNEKDRRTTRLLRDVDSPFVLLDRDVAGLASAPAVRSDHRSGILAAVDHLVGLGHVRVGFVGGLPTIRPTRERVQALRDAEELHPGLSTLVDCEAFTPEFGRRATAALLDAPEPPTAIIAGGNQLLAGVLAELRERRARVPRDLSLITCDRAPLGEFLQPPLATIDRDIREMGRAAAQVLLEVLMGQPPRQETLPVSFVPAASCAPPMTSTARVSRRA
jgi:LacI family transcriptional regulator